jgi:oligopeptidase A
MFETPHTSNSSKTTMNNLPLLARTDSIPFSALSAEQIAPTIDAALDIATKELETIKRVSGTRTFENTMRAYDNLALQLNFAMGIISHLESVATTPEWRTEYNAVLPRVSEFSSSIALDPDLWQAIKEYAATPEAQALSGEKKRFLKLTIDEFKRGGADLPEEKKKELTAIETELTEITTKFEQNVLDATNAFEFATTNEADLAGLPQSARDMGRASAAAKGLEGWRFTLQGPSYIAVMTYADSPAIRENFYRAYGTRCSSGELSNVDLLYRILDLRKAQATLLGFKDFSDFILEDRMAKKGETAEKFLRTLEGHLSHHVKNDQEALKAFVRNELKVDPSQMNPWDVTYYAEKMRMAHYDFDEEALRPYFALPKVMDGLFAIVERTFNISVKPNPSLQSWDKNVTTYSAFDTRSGEVLGHFYVDLFPRENKRGGAWMNGFVTRILANDLLPHVGLIAGNFTPPTESAPSLLTHDEVTTLFHEFGHLMHQLCSRTEMRSLSMDGVAWDFIELPSQILENWCWEREALDLMASHYQTGEKLPDELYQKMMKARNFRSASQMIRQVGFASVDLALHRTYSRERDGEILPFCRDLLNRFSTVPLPEDYAMIAGFTHLFSSPVGYAAAYYSYHWAEVLDADAFSRFQHEGIMNTRTGQAFRDTVLSRGDTEDADQLFRDFMGRDPDIQALLTRAGLSSTTA